MDIWLPVPSPLHVHMIYGCPVISSAMIFSKIEIKIQSHIYVYDIYKNQKNTYTFLYNSDHSNST